MTHQNCSAKGCKRRAFFACMTCTRMKCEHHCTRRLAARVRGAGSVRVIYCKECKPIGPLLGDAERARP